MYCPKCQTKDRTKVVDSRLQADQQIRRRRLCLKCNYRFSTIELPIPVPLPTMYGEAELKSALKQLIDLSKIKENVSSIIEKILQNIGTKQKGETN